MSQTPPTPSPADIADPEGERRKLEGFGAELLLSFVERVIAKNGGEDALGLRREAREIVTGGGLGKIAGLVISLDGRENQLDRPFRCEPFMLKRIGKPQPTHCHVRSGLPTSCELRIDVLPLNKARGLRHERKFLTHDLSVDEGASHLN